MFSTYYHKCSVAIIIKVEHVPWAYRVDKEHCNMYDLLVTTDLFFIFSVVSSCSCMLKVCFLISLQNTLNSLAGDYLGSMAKMPGM